MKKILLFVFLIIFTLNAQWIQQGSPFSGSPQNIQFFDKNSGVALGGNILYKTHDAGMNWNTYNSTFPGLNLYMVDSLTGFGGGQNTIYKTTNGGFSWDNLPVPQQNKFYNKFYFLNDTLGFVNGGDGQIFRTTNGGEAWALVSESGLGQIQSISFCDNEVGIASTSSACFKTTDAGKSWQQLPSPLPNSSIISAACLTRKNFVEMNGREIFLTFDGGVTWEPTYKFYSWQHEMLFVNDSIGFIAGTGIFKTTNGGKNWLIQSDPNKTYSYRNLSFFDENFGWCTQYWELYKTVNGSGPRFNYFTIDYPKDADTIYALTQVQSQVIPRRTVNIKYSPDNGKTYFDIRNNFDFYTYNSLTWTVPNTPSDKCKILIEDVERNEYSYETPGNFTIAPPPPLIVTRPGSYGSMNGGEYYDITWLSFNVDNIRIEFSADSGATWKTIIDSYPADSGKYRWRVPFLNSYYCRIKITDSANPLISDVNDGNFAIKLPNITISNPHAGAVFHYGEIINIKIESDYRGPVKLEFSSNGESSWQLIDSLNSAEWGNDFPTFYKVSKLYAWSVPDISADLCNFKITSYESNKVTCNSFTFIIRNNITIQSLIDAASPGDIITLSDSAYLECITINKPITLIGMGMNQTRITGDKFNPVITISSDKVVIKNLKASCKLKDTNEGGYGCSSSPTNGIEIINSRDIVLDSVRVFGSESVTLNWSMSGGKGLQIINCRNLNILNSEIYGADSKVFGSYRCGIDGGNGLTISNSDSIIISETEIKGGQGGNGWAHGATSAKGGYGGNAISLDGCSNISVYNSIMKGGIGGITSMATDSFFQSKAGDGVFCSHSDAFFSNSTLIGGDALTNTNTFLLNTFGGNGITATKSSRIILAGITLVAGSSSTDALGKLSYSDSSSSIIIDNTLLNTSITSFDSKLVNENVELIWKARFARSFMKFEVQRSIEKGVWNIIGALYKEDGKDDTFAFVDSILNKPFTTLRYRIKIVNLDSTFVLSEEKQIVNPLLTTYTLGQNYPNPFNPGTKINYSIPVQTFVNIKIYDVLGRVIQTLVNEEKPAGNYEFEFNGSALSNGIYFYRLQTGNFVETKKMILLK